MTSNKGFTLIEVLVTMIIVSVVISVSYYTFNQLLKNIRTEGHTVEATMDKIVGLELIRLDIEHAGYGISNDETCPVVRWRNSDDTCDSVTDGDNLILRSTLNNTNLKTFGWLVIDCESGDNWSDHIVLDQRKDSSVNDLVLLDYRHQYAFTANGTSTSCPNSGNFIGFPFDDTGANACLGGQTCTRVVYTLSQSQPLESCQGDTRNLLRKVGNGNGVPVLNCVADWDVRFWLDTDGDGSADTVTSGASLPADASTVRNQLKAISIFALVQEGYYDPKYQFDGNVTVDDGNGGDVTLTFPAGCTSCRNYHWKVIKLTTRCMDL